MTDVYNEGQQPDPAEAVVPPTNEVQLPDEVLEFVGPGKKYATLAEALKSVPNAQAHISTLESELKALREAQGKALSQEEVYATVQDYLKQHGGQAVAGLDEAGVAALLDRKLKEAKQQEVVAANVSAFKAAMGAKFGDKQKEMFDAKAAELGMTVQKLGELVASSPKAALTLFGIEGSKTAVGVPPPGGVNTDALSVHNQQQPPPMKLRGATTADISKEWAQLKAAVLKKHGLS